MKEKEPVVPAEEEALTAYEIAQLKALIKERNEEKPAQKEEEVVVTRAEIERVNRRFRLSLDLGEEDLETLVMTAIHAMVELYGISVKSTGNLTSQFHASVDAVSQQLLERNKEKIGKAKASQDPVILKTLDQIERERY